MSLPNELKEFFAANPSYRNDKICTSVDQAIGILHCLVKHQNKFLSRNGLFPELGNFNRQMAALLPFLYTLNNVGIGVKPSENKPLQIDQQFFPCALLVSNSKNGHEVATNQVGGVQILLPGAMVVSGVEKQNKSGLQGLGGDTSMGKLESGVDGKMEVLEMNSSAYPSASPSVDKMKSGVDGKIEVIGIDSYAYPSLPSSPSTSVSHSPPLSVAEDMPAVKKMKN